MILALRREHVNKPLSPRIQALDEISVQADKGHYPTDTPACRQAGSGAPARHLALLAPSPMFKIELCSVRLGGRGGLTDSIPCRLEKPFSHEGCIHDSFLQYMKVIHPEERAVS